jgi:uncharacterized membrane protein
MQKLLKKKLQLLLKIFTHDRFWHYLAILIVILFILAGILVSVHRFWQYDVFFYDFGIFDQAIWKASRFQIPTIEHLVVRNKIIFADHFNPSIFLLTPLYWLTDRQEVLLIAQAVIVGLSGYVLFLIGRHVLKSSFFGFGVTALYFLYVGLQNAIITDFHEITIAVLPLMLVWYAVVKKRLWLYVLSLLLFLGCKESTFIAGVGIGIAIFFLQKEWRKIALVTIAFSLLYGLVVIGFVIPYFAGGEYQYQYKSELDGKIYQLPATLLDHPEKQRTIFFSLASFGFLPLLSPEFWLLLLSDFYSRFYSEQWFTRWGLGFHYNAIPAVVLAISSLYGLRRLKKYIGSYSYAVMCLLLVNGLILSLFILHAPFGLSYNRAFYQHSGNFAFLDTLLDHVPKNAKVMAQNNLAARLTHGDVMLLIKELPVLKDEEKPEYIVLDLRAGQNPNNFFPFVDIQEFVAIMKLTGEYKIYYEQGEQVIYKR